MSADLGRGGLARHIAVQSPEVPPQSRLVGHTMARVAGLEADRPLRIWNEDQSGRCRGCGEPLPLPDELSMPVEDESVTMVSDTGPIFLVDGSHRTYGSLNRNRHWYCIACAVNHPGGEEVRRRALTEGWGQVYAWDPSSGPYSDFTYLARVMHSAARAGAAHGLPRLSMSGLKYGDIWILPRNVTSYISRCSTTRGFPLDRPGTLAERIKWSGPALAALVGTSMWREIEKLTFVMLQSHCLRRHEYSALPKRWDLPEPAVVAPAGSEEPPAPVALSPSVDPFADHFREPARPEDALDPDVASDTAPGERPSFPDLPMAFEDDEPEM